jgi:hypothetical protein
MIRGLGFILFVIGGLIWIFSVSMNPEMVTHQTIQYLSYLIATILMVGGCIVIALGEIDKHLKNTSNISTPKDEAVQKQ